jgi:ATP-dependent helicase/nuclease subunit B
MFKSLFQTLQPNTLLLTANKRLASWVTNQYDELQSPQTKKDFKILPFVDWIQLCWQNYQMKNSISSSILLNQHQEHALWQSIIREHSNNELIQISATANAAQQAWQLLKQWGISLDDSRLKETFNSRNFLKWARIFTNLCQEKKWIDNASLLENVYDQFNNNKIEIPANITLIGFLEFTPAMQQLIKTLTSHGCKITRHEINHKNSKAKCFASTTTETEIYTMARWAKYLVEHEHNVSIGCVIPELNECRTDAERIFTEVFKPKSQSYNISSGQSFSNEPAIYTALKILHLSKFKSSTYEIGHLLRSPFLGYAEKEFTQRAILDAKIRQTGNIKFTLSQLVQTINSIKTYCPQLLEQFKTLQKITSQQKQSNAEWINVFSEQLKSMGWPGERKLNSNEYQTIKRWGTLLQEFASLDLVQKPTTYSQALRSLQHLATQTSYQPQTSINAPVQVLGMLEATGLSFTHIWVMGLDNHRWPPPANPNLLLPSLLQHQLQMPHSSAEREYHFTKIITKQFLKTASNIIFSHPSQKDDHSLQPSSLINNFSKIIQEELPLAPLKTFMEQKITPQNLEENIDSQAPPTQNQEMIFGGANILKQQAACPFRAFATFRLHAHELNEPTEGINSLERGLILHKVLELLWQQIKSQNKLMQLTEIELKQLIDKDIARAIKATTTNKHISPALEKLEKKCLANIVMEWLTIEKSRKEFEVIALEQKYKTQIGALSFDVRIDRIDQLENGGYALIDYKSGKTNISSWFSDRPEEPQLPIYAIAATKNISAISFAQINPNEMKFKSVCVSENLLPKSKTLAEIKVDGAETNWEKQFNRWKETLEKLAKDFCCGDARVDPKNLAETCKHCKLQALCRKIENSYSHTSNKT